MCSTFYGSWPPPVSPTYHYFSSWGYTVPVWTINTKCKWPELSYHVWVIEASWCCHLLEVCGISSVKFCDASHSIPWITDVTIVTPQVTVLGNERVVRLVGGQTIIENLKFVFLAFHWSVHLPFWYLGFTFSWHF